MSVVNMSRNQKRLAVLLFGFTAMALVVLIMLLLLSNLTRMITGGLEPYEYLNAALLIAGVLFFVGLTQAFSEQIRTEQTKEEIKEIRDTATETPGKIKPVWDEAAVIMRSYFDRNLGQLRLIFWLSLAAMIFGFILIIFSVNSSQNSGNNLAVIAAGVAGILSEFIAGTFLFVYRSTVEQANSYLQSLEKINSVGMALQILDTVATEDNQANKDKLLDARIEIARLLLTNSPNTKNE